MKLLLLLTTSFPYDNGEEFLLNEINYISGYDRVLICPCNLKPDSAVTKKLPDFISCVPLRTAPLAKSAYAGLLLKPFVQKELFTMMKTGVFTTEKAHEMLFFMKRAYEIYAALSKLSELSGADDVTIYSYWLYDAAAAGALLAADLRRQGKKVKQVSRAHRFDLYSEFAKLNYLPMREFLLSRVDRVLPCSASGAEYLQKQYLRYAEKIAPAFLGTADHGEKHGSRGEELHIVSCSFIAPVKRLHLIVQALEQADFPILWTHIGSGPLRGEIEEMASKLPDCVRTEWKGQMDNAAIMDYYRGNDLSAFVNVSASEGIPVSIMEVSSFGVPVIATDVGGTREAVCSGENGYLLPPDFLPQELMSRLRELKELSDEDYSRLCRNARRIWAEKFSAQKNYQNFYKEISQ
ncbi:glycosyltransferase [Caproiciproducens faecalis]|uniref:Glycosyltransferase n=1 Tax=Caproiciproducens faecalis TaxID=2820301 RepID=A0ABS7DQA7_9FIRM|nr:glycosyltransferase [Caproiciproducens faecalis]MBW7573398.1 glycosyltransferase [Caproiciproducens faecalis]